MSVDQIASALWRNRLIFVATFLACLAAVIVVTFSLPKAYRSTATLFVGDEQTAKALEFNPTLGESLTRTYSTLREPERREFGARAIAAEADAR